MTERERLIEILNDWGNKENDGIRAEIIADYLLDNGVIVSPTGLGEVVRCLNGNKIIKAVVMALKFLQTKDGIKCGLTLIDESGDKMICSAADIGQIIFLTEEEAEKALKEIEKE